MSNANKLSYKLEILYNKYSPFIIGIILFLYHILNFIFPQDLMFIVYFCMPSLCTAFHMYNSREAFRLCKVHRCAVNYVIGNLFLEIIEYYWINPYMNIWWLSIIVGFTIIGIILGIIYYKQEH